MSRDPNRIKPIIELLEELWERHPDQRLGQLFSNYVTKPTKLQEVSDEDIYLALTKGTHRIPKEIREILNSDTD